MAAGPTVKKIMETYRDRVRLVVKNYPYKYRDYAYTAALASLAARDQGRYWEMHDVMIARSPRLDRENLVKYAKELGLDVERFTRDLDGRKHAPLVDRDLKLALDMDLYNTPTFFINGRKLVGNRPFEDFKKVIEEELKASPGRSGERGVGSEGGRK